jgi:hypothetical protein
VRVNNKQTGQARVRESTPLHVERCAEAHRLQHVASAAGADDEQLAASWRLLLDQHQQHLRRQSASSSKKRTGHARQDLEQLVAAS